MNFQRSSKRRTEQSREKKINASGLGSYRKKCTFFVLFAWYSSAGICFEYNTTHTQVITYRSLFTIFIEFIYAINFYFFSMYLLKSQKPVVFFLNKIKSHTDPQRCEQRNKCDDQEKGRNENMNNAYKIGSLDFTSTRHHTPYYLLYYII